MSGCSGTITGCGRAAQLFDLAADPGEKNDLAAKHPEVVSRLTAEARKFDAGLQRDKREQVYEG